MEGTVQRKVGDREIEEVRKGRWQLTDYNGFNTVKGN